jgi:hypothetical protein
MVGQDFHLLFRRAAFAAVFLKCMQFGLDQGKRQGNLKNVIRSDGDCRIELLGSHPGCS